MIAPTSVDQHSVGMERFIEIVRNVGCHPVSRRIRRHFAPELLRTGVPIIATDVDGIPEFVYLTRRTPGSTGDLARRSGAGLARMLDGPDRLPELQENAWRRRRNAFWPARRSRAEESAEPMTRQGTGAETVGHYR
jgi:glycosyltransferase involved in cell wall biosynthesis